MKKHTLRNLGLSIATAFAAGFGSGCSTAGPITIPENFTRTIESVDSFNEPKYEVKKTQPQIVAQGEGTPEGQAIPQPATPKPIQEEPTKGKDAWTLEAKLGLNSDRNEINEKEESVFGSTTLSLRTDDFTFSTFFSGQHANFGDSVFGLSYVGSLDKGFSIDLTGQLLGINDLGYLLDLGLGHDDPKNPVGFHLNANFTNDPQNLTNVAGETLLRTLGGYLRFNTTKYDILSLNYFNSHVDINNLVTVNNSVFDLQNDLDLNILNLFWTRKLDNGALIMGPMYIHSKNTDIITGEVDRSDTLNLLAAYVNYFKSSDAILSANMTFGTDDFFNGFGSTDGRFEAGIDYKWLIIPKGLSVSKDFESTNEFGDYKTRIAELQAQLDTGNGNKDEINDEIERLQEKIDYLNTRVITHGPSLEYTKDWTANRHRLVLGYEFDNQGSWGLGYKFDADLLETAAHRHKIELKKYLGNSNEYLTLGADFSDNGNNQFTLGFNFRW